MRLEKGEFIFYDSERRKGCAGMFMGYTETYSELTGKFICRYLHIKRCGNNSISRFDERNIKIIGKLKLERCE